MTRFFDTSVLVAAAVDYHPHFSSSFRLLRRDDAKGATSAHCLAEFYNTLTRGTGHYRRSGAEAMAWITRARDRLAVASMGGSDYVSALNRAAAFGVSGPVVYDFLIGVTAQLAGADELFTWNVKHFNQFRTAFRMRVLSPAEASN